ncbi:MAG: hypothetical protein JWP97_1584 [Labilithrix sp.]|nr:hypothetical protein [Labilithrix sp.]
MMPKVKLWGLTKSKWWEHLLRFVFGGLVTVGAGLVAQKWGPHVGGLFLAFPSILPASLTLVKRHDGRSQAVHDARGARIGAAAMAVFALTVVALVGRSGGLALAIAGVVWLAASVLGWFLVYGRGPRDAA